MCLKIEEEQGCQNRGQLCVHMFEWKKMWSYRKSGRGRPGQSPGGGETAEGGGGAVTEGGRVEQDDDL